MTETPRDRSLRKAREASIRSKKLRAARRHLTEHIEALELLGYTVVAPDNEEPLTTP